MVAIGTNNLTGRYSACSIEAGIAQIVSQLRSISPAAEILVLAIPAIYRDSNRFEEERLAVNSALVGMGVTTIGESGNLPCSESECSSYRPDRVHLTPFGYQKISDAIRAKTMRKQ